MLKIWSESVKYWWSYEEQLRWKRTKKNKERTRLDQSNVFDWKVFSVLLKTKFIIQYICRSSIWFDLSRFEPNPTVINTNISKWFGQELTELWIAKSNDKERICIYVAIDPKGKRDIEGHMVFYMTKKATWTTQITLTKFWLNLASNKREICVESLMTSCLSDQRWHRKVFLPNKSYDHSIFIKTSFILIQR